MYDDADALFDAWCCLVGSAREVFPVDDLLIRYPSLRTEIANLRAAMKIVVPTIDRNDDIRGKRQNDVVAVLKDLLTKVAAT